MSSPRTCRTDAKTGSQARRDNSTIAPRSSMRNPRMIVSSATAWIRYLPAVRPDELDRRLRARLDALGPAPRAELLRVLMLPDFERADRIGEFWGYPESRAFAELLIDCEEVRTLRAVLVGMLRETEQGR